MPRGRSPAPAGGGFGPKPSAARLDRLASTLSLDSNAPLTTVTASTSYAELSASLSQLKNARKNVRRDFEREKRRQAKTFYARSLVARMPEQLLTWAYVDAPPILDEKKAHAKLRLGVATRALSLRQPHHHRKRRGRSKHHRGVRRRLSSQSSSGSLGGSSRSPSVSGSPMGHHSRLRVVPSTRSGLSLSPIKTQRRSMSSSTSSLVDSSPKNSPSMRSSPSPKKRRLVMSESDEAARRSSFSMMDEKSTREDESRTSGTEVVLADRVSASILSLVDGSHDVAVPAELSSLLISRRSLRRSSSTTVSSVATRRSSTTTSMGGARGAIGMMTTQTGPPEPVDDGTGTIAPPRALREVHLSRDGTIDGRGVRAVRFGCWAVDGDLLRHVVALGTTVEVLDFSPPGRSTLVPWLSAFAPPDGEAEPRPPGSGPSVEDLALLAAAQRGDGGSKPPLMSLRSLSLKHCAELSMEGPSGGAAAAAIIVRGFFSACAATLVDLDLSASTLGCGVAEAVAACSHLESLKLNSLPEDAVEDEGLRALGASCSALKHLELRRCRRATDRGVAFVLARCARLAHLNLAECSRISGDFVRYQGTDSSSSSSSSSSSLPSPAAAGAVVVTPHGGLRELDLSGCAAVKRPAFVEWLPRAFPHLEALSLAHLHNAVLPRGLRHLADFQLRLRHLDLHGCHLAALDDGEALTDLVRSMEKILEYLDIRKIPKLSAEAVAACLEVPHLATLKCDGVHGLREALFGTATVLDSVHRIAAALLKVVDEASEDLRTKKGDDDSIPSAEAQQVRAQLHVAAADVKQPLIRKGLFTNQITALSVRDCPGCTAGVVACLVSRAPQLLVLNLAGCPGLTDGAMAIVASRCPNLLVLDASRRTHGSSFVTDTGLRAVAAHLPALEALHLDHQIYVTGAGFLVKGSRPRGCPRRRGGKRRNNNNNNNNVVVLAHLRALSMTGCTAVDAPGLKVIKQVCPSLVDLELTGCSLVEAQDVHEVAKHLCYVHDYSTPKLVGTGAEGATGNNGGTNCAVVTALTMTTTKMRVEKRGFRLSKHGAVAERRDVYALRFAMEAAACRAMWVAWQWHKTRRRILFRVKVPVVVKALRWYLWKTKDAARRGFIRHTIFVVFVRRAAACRLQRFWRRWSLLVRASAAVRIQRMYRASATRWLQDFMVRMLRAQRVIAAFARGSIARRDGANLPARRLARQWGREVARGLYRDGVYDDAYTRAALTDMGAKLRSLQSKLARDKSAATREKKYGRHTTTSTKAIKAAIRGSPSSSLSLPVSHKHRIPVYGDGAPVRPKDGEDMDDGAVHIFTGGLWPVELKPPKPEPAVDMDPASGAYHLRAQRADRNAVLSDEFAKDHAGGAGSLLPALKAARLAQAKQRMLMDRVANLAAQKEIEDALALETLLAEQAEAERKRVEVENLASEREKAAASTMANLVRSLFTRKRWLESIRTLTATQHADRLAQEARAVTEVQRVARAYLLRSYNFEHHVPALLCDADRLLSRGLQPTVRGTPMEKAVKARLAERALVDYAARRRYERAMAIFHRRELGDECERRFEAGLKTCAGRLETYDRRLAGFKSTLEANGACLAALQATLGRFTQALVGEEAASKRAEIQGRKEEAEAAIAAASVRKRHLEYAVEAVAEAGLASTEALRCHYRRHRAQRVVTAEVGRKLRWIAIEAHKVEALKTFVVRRLDEAPEGHEHRYYVAWLADQRQRAVDQSIRLDAEQEQLLKDDVGQMRDLLRITGTSATFVDTIAEGKLQDACWDAEKVGLQLAYKALPKDSDEALDALERATLLKARQTALRDDVVEPMEGRMEALLAAEEKRVQKVCAFTGDGHGLPREAIPHIAAVLRIPPKPLPHFERDKWEDVFRAQPWLVQQEQEEAKRKEARDVKRVREESMAAVVDQRRVELEAEAEEMAGLEKRIAALTAKAGDSSKGDRLDREEARLEALSLAAQLDQMKQDHERRENTLERLVDELAAFRTQLEVEDAEARERLLAAERAKKEFDEREGIEDAKRRDEAEDRKVVIAADLDRIKRDLDALLQKQQQKKSDGAGEEDHHPDDDNADADADNKNKKELTAEDEAKRADLEKRRAELEAELAAMEAEERRRAERAKLREEASEAAEAEAKRKAEADALKLQQERLRLERREEMVRAAREKRERDERAAKEREEAQRREQEAAAMRRANENLLDMGLLDPETRREDERKKPVDKKVAGALKRALRRAVTGSKETAAQEAHETNHMVHSVMRRQKAGMGVATAIRKFKLTVGKAETETFGERQTDLMDRGLPHLVRLPKSIGSHDVVALWYEESADQDEFISHVELGHSSPSHQLYRGGDLGTPGSPWLAAGHDLLCAGRPFEPGFVVWAKKDPQATLVVGALAVSYSTREGEVLERDGFEAVEPSLDVFGFATSRLWVKKVDRNKPPIVENQESVLRDLKATLKELRERPDDPLFQERRHKLAHKLEELRVDEEFRTKYDEDPLKYAIEFLGLTQRELEAWLDHFERMDEDQAGVVSIHKIWAYCNVRETHFLSNLVKNLVATSDVDEAPDPNGKEDHPVRYRLDFGETVKALGQFAMFSDNEILHALFTLYDTDNSGSITHTELLDLLADLHPPQQRGATKRALKEIDLDDGKAISYDSFLDAHAKFPSLFFPALQMQYFIRQTFGGNRHWDRKQRKYMDIKDEIRLERANNTDKMEASEAAQVQRRERRAKAIEAKRAAALTAKSKLKRSLLATQIYALNVAQARDKPVNQNKFVVKK